MNKNTRVLIVEDDPVIAREMDETLREAGLEIAGMAGSLEKAIAMIDDETCDVVVLDVNLRGESVEPLASMLQRRGTPFVFVSGYGRVHLPDAFLDAPLISKPFERRDLVEAIERLLPPGPRPR